MKQVTCSYCGVLLAADDPDNICWTCFLDGGYRSEQEVLHGGKISRNVRYVTPSKENRHSVDDKPKAIKKADAEKEGLS